MPVPRRRDPSAAVSYDLQGFNCLACNVRGDVISIIQHEEEVSFAEAKRIAEGLYVGSHIPVQVKPARKPGRRVFGEQGSPGRNTFGLGFVGDPLPGHELYRGCPGHPVPAVVILAGMVGRVIRFRRLDDGKPKYMTLPGDKPRLFNTNALTHYSRDMAITEGEIDAITAEWPVSRLLVSPEHRCGSPTSASYSWGIAT